MLTGTVERVVYHSEDSGFCVLRVNARGRRGLASVIGHAQSIGPGEWVTATGEWNLNPKYGEEFRAKFLKVSPPSTESGIHAYLSSGMIYGIGPVYARKLLRKFGDKVLDVIEFEPERLTEVPGIGPVRAQSISKAWEEHKAVRDIMVFLHTHGVGTARAVRIYRNYGNDAVQVLSENPYRLAKDIRGIGFKIADSIATQLGIEHDDPHRIQAGIDHVLTEATNQGSCGLPVEALRAQASKLLGVGEDRVADGERLELESGNVIEGRSGRTQCYFLYRTYRAEVEIAGRLRKLSRSPPPWSRIDAEKAIAWVERNERIEFAPSQQDAIRKAIESKTLIITGGPGVGKTTIVNAILKILSAKKVAALLCAPTGRAAKRMSEATSMESKTIHRLLAFDPSNGGFRHDEDDQLDCDLLVVDETSMVDVFLMNSLLKALPDHSAVLFVGDKDQLPSVGPGKVLGDMIDSGTLPVVHLTEVFRQAAKSKIIVASHQINKGSIPDLKPPEEKSDFYFVDEDDAAKIPDLVVSLVKKRIPDRFGFDPVREIQVLCPMNRGGAGAHALNLAIQSALGSEDAASIEKFGWRFSVGDKVMQIANDYDKDVFNGDIGFVECVDPKEGVLKAYFDGRIVPYFFGELDFLVPAYAVSIHKSQGSEYPAVVIPLLTSHYIMLKRNLLYTGVTRGKQLVVLVGQKRAVDLAVKDFTTKNRWSKLKDWLVGASDRTAR
ncbi:MAG: ATP-dependent RecD-like DNA helicase [Albidovulum sp.]|nr:ATP-dependent RecD-like DNA helicase [Albidovulum sp.]